MNTANLNVFSLMIFALTTFQVCSCVPGKDFNFSQKLMQELVTFHVIFLICFTLTFVLSSCRENSEIRAKRWKLTELTAEVANRGNTFLTFYLARFDKFKWLENYV